MAQATGKIRITKQNHQNETTAANPHNTHLDKKEAEVLSSIDKIRGFETFNINIFDNIVEWYLRTLSDELYKLAFIDNEKYYKIKMFQPKDYEDNFWKQFLDNNNPEVIKAKNNCTYYLKQFDGFDIEDYFDIIILPHISTQERKVKFIILLNSFTFFIQDYQKQVHSNCQGLELFFQQYEELSPMNDKDLSFLAQITNFILEKYVLRKEQTQNLQIEKKVKIEDQDLRSRIVPILQEKTRVVLYELYQDI